MRAGVMVLPEAMTSSCACPLDMTLIWVPPTSMTSVSEPSSGLLSLMAVPPSDLLRLGLRRGCGFGRGAVGPVVDKAPMQDGSDHHQEVEKLVRPQDPGD